MNRAEPLKSPLLFHYFDFGPPKQIFQGLGARWFSVQSNLGVLGFQLVFGETWGLLNAYCPLSSLTGSLSRGCLGFSLSLEVRGGFFVWGATPSGTQCSHGSSLLVVLRKPSGCQGAALSVPAVLTLFYSELMPLASRQSSSYPCKRHPATLTSSRSGCQAQDRGAFQGGLRGSAENG